MSAELKLCVHELSNHTQKFDSFNSILQLEKLEGRCPKINSTDLVDCRDYTSSFLTKENPSSWNMNFTLKFFEEFQKKDVVDNQISFCKHSCKCTRTVNSQTQAITSGKLNH